MHSRRRNVNLIKGAHRQARRRRSRRLGQSESYNTRRLLHAHSPQDSLRRTTNGLRRPQGQPIGPGHGSSHRNGQERGRGAGHFEIGDILPTRELRTVYALQGRQQVDGADHEEIRGRAGASEGD